MSTDVDSAIDPEKINWDVVVIGTGMGGGTLGHALAKAGRRVLFVEKGLSLLPERTGLIVDHYPEEDIHLDDLDEATTSFLERAGRSTDEIEDVSQQKETRFTAYIGSGTGGSSALYGMALERFFASDFEPGACHSYIGRSTLPERWPISYADMKPWYEAAEKLYQVRGTPDPLRPEDAPTSLIPAPELTPGNAELFQFFRRQQLHPYQLHMGCGYKPECEACQGYLCSSDCKKDAGSVCVTPAVLDHGAHLLDRCKVLKIESERTAVQKIVCSQNGRLLGIRGRIFVLAAGALISPALLLASKSDAWPNGLANDSDMVGRNLMRHCVDVYSVRPQYNLPLNGQIKEIAFNDLYQSAAGKLGTVQSLGRPPPFQALINSAVPGRQLMRILRPLAEPWWQRNRQHTLTFASIMEDLPYLDNRVIVSDRSNIDGRQRVKLSYNLHQSELNRLEVFRQEIRGLMGPYHPFMLSTAAANSQLGHVCGTCRFGNDPKESVLDATNRAHGLDNLYVADSSFFPSSSGINPSLTIAANALRVAAHINQRF